MGRGVLKVALAGAALALVAPASAEAQLSVDDLRFKFETALKRSDGAIDRREHAAVANAPTAIDVNGGTPDLQATVQATSGQGPFTVRVQKLAPGALPISIEAVAEADPSKGRSAAFGYDALAGSAPTDFSAQLSFAIPSSTASVKTTQVSVVTSALAGATPVKVIGEVFRLESAKPLGQRRGIPRIQARYGPVTGAATLTARHVDDVAARKVSVDLRASQPAPGAATIATVSGSRQKEVKASVDRVPSNALLVIDENTASSGGTAKVVSYDAGPGARALDAAFVERVAGKVEKDVTLKLRETPDRGLPKHVDVTHVEKPRPTGGDEDHSVVLEADEPLGLGVARFATGEAPATRSLTGCTGKQRPPHWLHVADDGKGRAVAVQISGLQKAKASVTESELELAATLAAGCFRARIEKGKRLINASIGDLPAQVSLKTGLPKLSSVSYSGSAPIARLAVSASDPNKLFKRAKRLEFELLGVPTQLSFKSTAGEDSKDVRFDAGGATLAKIELMATDKVERLLPSGTDGVIVEETPAAYQLFARLSGLRSVRMTKTEDSSGDVDVEQTDMRLDATANRPFVADVRRTTAISCLAGTSRIRENPVDDDEQSSGGGPRLKSPHVRAAISPLRPSTRITIKKTHRGERCGGKDETRLSYSAAARSDALELDLYNGQRRNTAIELTPLPAQLDVCKGDDGRCHGPRNGSDGSALLLTPEPVAQPGALRGDGSVLPDRPHERPARGPADPQPARRAQAQLPAPHRLLEEDVRDRRARHRRIRGQRPDPQARRRPHRSPARVQSRRSLRALGQDEPQPARLDQLSRRHTLLGPLPNQRRAVHRQGHPDRLPRLLSRRGIPVLAYPLLFQVFDPAR